MIGAHVLEAQIQIRDGAVRLPGFLAIPEHPSGLVLFAHGSGSGRFSSRNARIAEALRKAGLATLLFDLLTENEAAARANVFDIPLLAARLLTATQWALEENPGVGLGYFGASTGAAAALLAASEAGNRVKAVVSRGGRPDLALGALPRVRAPTLLIVGSLDTEVLDLNRQAYHQLRCAKRLVVVPGAGHLFEEGDTLLEVAGLAQGWFLDQLVFRTTDSGLRTQDPRPRVEGPALGGPAVSRS